MPPTVRTTMGPIDAVLVVVAFLAGGLQGTLASALITALCASVAIGVWRAVRILGHLLEQAQEDAVAREEAEA